MATGSRAVAGNRTGGPTRDAAAAAAAFNLNALNIALMLVAGVLSFAWPFEVLIGSFLLLGPLHGLTELSWLHDRKYFTDSKAGPALLGASALVMMAPAVLAPTAVNMGPSVLLFACFVASAGLVVARSLGARLVLAALALGGALLLLRNPLLALVGLFLPTVIHLFVFTGLFILTGAMRSHSKLGLLSLAVFVACAAALLLLPVTGPIRPLAGVVREAISVFSLLIGYLARHFPLAGGDAKGAVVVAARFLAYITLYHYLNWFSKTRVIGWHAVGRKRLLLVGGLWLASLAALAVSLRAGILFAATLSTLHVVLEFPLNWRSFGSVITLSRSRSTAAPTPAPAVAAR